MVRLVFVFFCLGCSGRSNTFLGYRYQKLCIRAAKSVRYVEQTAVNVVPIKTLESNPESGTKKTLATRQTPVC